MKRLFVNALFCLGIILFLSQNLLQAGNYPAGVVESVYATGLSRPVQMAFAPDGRLFVAEQYGTLRVIKNGILLPTPALTVNVNTTGERGLLSVAFDPDFAVNKHVYVFYTHTIDPKTLNNPFDDIVENRASRFESNGDVLLPATEFILLRYNASNRPYHNAGAMHFGPDGKLYIAIGDNVRSGVSQRLDNIYGKMLRINKDGSTPPDNPFYATLPVPNPDPNSDIDPQTGAKRPDLRLMWAIGLRNPFSFDMHPTSGRMYINDVGENTWEEVNEGIGGSNYGWRLFEGPSNDPRFRSPVYSYRHNPRCETPAELASPECTPLPSPIDPNRGCSVIGASFYTPTVTPKLPSQYVGRYFFGDVCNRWMRVLDPATNTTEVFATNTFDPVDIRQGPDGALYYVAREGGNDGSGRVFRIALAGQEPAITSQPADQTVIAGRSVTFSAQASGTAPLNYQWQRNGVVLPGATQANYTLSSVTLADNGALFRVVVTNSVGSATSREARLTVTENQDPTATITTPALGTLYTAGTRISYSGTATDPEDGTLPASAFTWEVKLHHNVHTHPVQPPTSGSRTGSFLIPRNDHSESDVWYRITLTVRDSGGRTSTVVTRDVNPRKSQITLQTVPAGLRVAFEGASQVAPFVEPSVIGVYREINAPTPQVVGGVTYQFVSWSDGGAASHRITTATSNTTYTATFQAVCGANTTDQLAVTRGGFRLNATTRRYVQTVTLRNISGTALTGPLSLVLDNLSSNATLYGSAGSTGCSVPMGSPFVNVNLGTDNALAPNESVAVVLEFNNPSNQGIIYSTRTVGGAGAR